MALTELRLLKHINEPGLATREGYERYGTHDLPDTVAVAGRCADDYVL